MEYEEEEYELTFVELYPDLTPAEQAEAEYYLTRYVEVMHSIFTRLQQQNLTESNHESNMRMN